MLPNLRTAALLLACLAAACTSGSHSGAPPVVVTGLGPPPSDAPDAGSSTPTGGADAGAPADAGNAAPPPTQACLAAPILQQLGKQHLVTGADMTVSVAEQAPFDIRYLYLAGGIADGSGTCQSCAQGCTAAGLSCANTAGCDYWACWQDDQLAPGQYILDFISQTQAMGQIPLITYYELLQTGRMTEGTPEVAALTDTALVTRWFNDFRLLLQRVGKSAVLLHVEPDFWGYAEQYNPDPHAARAAVNAANPTDCAGQEDSVAGFGHCIVAMVRKYAPAAKVGLHGSGWATKMDALSNVDPSLDVAAEGRKLGAFLTEVAPDADFIGLDAADRDAAYDVSIGHTNVWWDATNATLPDFHQAFTWGRAVTTQMQKPALWWQLPLGNAAQNNTETHWQDNRVDYFFAHPDEVAATNAFGFVFGAGEVHQTNPSTDGGNLVAKVRAYAAAGGQPVCR